MSKYIFLFILFVGQHVKAQQSLHLSLISSAHYFSNSSKQWPTLLRQQSIAAGLSLAKHFSINVGATRWRRSAIPSFLLGGDLQPGYENECFTIDTIKLATCRNDGAIAAYGWFEFVDLFPAYAGSIRKCIYSIGIGPSIAKGNITNIDKVIFHPTDPGFAPHAEFTSITKATTAIGYIVAGKCYLPFYKSFYFGTNIALRNYSKLQFFQIDYGLGVTYVLNL
jgi:hypothetical protein